MVLRSNLFPILIAIGCISSGYTENSNVKQVYNIPTSIINSKQTIGKVTTNNTNIYNNKTEKQLSISEQLDKRIEYINNLIKSIYSKDTELSNIIQSFKNEHPFDSLDSISYDLKQKLSREAEDAQKHRNALLYFEKIGQEKLVFPILELEKIVLILKALKNTDVFPKMVDFVRENSKDLLDGKSIDFTPFYNEITKNTINNKLNNVLYPKEVILNNLLKENGLPEINDSTNSSDLINIQVLLMFETLAMCPELKVEHVLKLDNKGKLIDGVKINNSEQIYGYSYGNGIGINKTSDLRN